MSNVQNTESNLKKDLGIVASMAMVIGMVIGSGIFMKPGIVLGNAGDSTHGLMAWVLGGIITMAAGLTLAELGVLFPKTGGLYIYIDEIYGKTASFLFGWVQTLIYGPATIGALGAYFGALLIPFIGLDESAKLPVGIAAVVFIAIVNSIGTKYGGIIQSVATVAKLIPIFLIAIFGLIKGNGQVLGMAANAKQSLGMGAAILATLWAYDGWASVAFMAGEMKDPAKILPRAIIGGLLVVITAYLSINFALLKMIPASQVTELGRQASGHVAGLLFGEFGGRLLSVGILISIFGALNGNVLSLPRVPYAMACRGQLPGSSIFSRVHSSFGTPIYATALQAGIAILLMTLADPDKLTDWAMFSIWIFYTLGFVGVFITRSKLPDVVRSYKVPLYPVIPVIAIGGSLYILYSTLTGSPTDSMISLGITAAGIPVFYLMSKGKK